MTIASHCLALLHERGPLTAEELGSECHVAGVTTSRNPTQAVINALNWTQDGRAFMVGERFRAVTELLEGRWLTFHPSLDGRPTLKPDLDLACLTRLVEREGLPLAGGGTITAERYGLHSWSGPDGWLPTGETVGLRLVGGVAEVSTVVVDDAAEVRGARLVELLTEGNRHESYRYRERRELTSQRLLALIDEHDDLLRDPVPPLSDLFPAPPEQPRRDSCELPPPFWPSVQVDLTPELHQHLEAMAFSMGKPLGRWLSEQLEWLAECPTLLHLGPHLPYRDIHEARERYAADGSGDPEWDPSFSLLPFVRSRGDDLSAS